MTNAPAAASTLRYPASAADQPSRRVNFLMPRNTSHPTKGRDHRHVEHVQTPGRKPPSANTSAWTVNTTVMASTAA